MPQPASINECNGTLKNGTKLLFYIFYVLQRSIEYFYEYEQNFCLISQENIFDLKDARK